MKNALLQADPSLSIRWVICHRTAFSQPFRFRPSGPFRSGMHDLQLSPFSDDWRSAYNINLNPEGASIFSRITILLPTSQVSSYHNFQSHFSHTNKMQFTTSQSPFSLSTAAMAQDWQAAVAAAKPAPVQQSRAPKPSHPNTPQNSASDSCGKNPSRC